MANLDLPLIDINLAIWDTEKAGQIEIDDKKGTVKALVDYEPSCDEELRSKLLRVMQHYESKEINITRGRLTTLVKNESSDYNYLYHDYLMALHSIVESKQVQEYEITVPANKTVGRPYHKFVFLGFPDNPNEEWNAKEVNKWISTFEKKKVK